MTVTEDRHEGHPLGVQVPAQQPASAREAINEMLDAGLLDDLMDRVEGGGLTLLAVLDFGRRYEQAVLGWFDALPPALTEPAGPTTAP